MIGSDVGILTVARYLREGIGKKVRCFVNTRSGLREMNNLVGRPGKMLATLVAHPRRNFVQLPVKVHLNTEIFLARRDLTGMTRKEILTTAECAASVNALAFDGSRF